MAEKPTPPTWEEISGAHSGSSLPDPPVLLYSKRTERNEAFRPHWVQRTLRDILYEKLVEHWREHQCNPTGIELARFTERPYTSVRAALCELRAEGRLIHRGKGVSVPVDCLEPSGDSAVD